MPKNPLKNFARRKSSGNILDLPSESTTSTAPASSSFRVIERPDKVATTVNGGRPGGPVKRTSGGRPGSSILLNRKSGKSQEDLLASANRSVPEKSQSRPHTVYGALKLGRGSGGTALSGSSGYFDNSSSSARYSSSSTLPSSIEAEHEAENEDLFPRKTAANGNSNLSSNRSSAASNAVPEPPSFSARAGRAMSFGLRSKQNTSPGTMTAATAHMPDLPENSFIRDRATTMSSNASTAVPPRIDASLGSMSDFGSDFGMNMFEGLSSPRQAKSNMAAPQPAHDNYGRSVRRQQSPGFNNYNNAYQQRPYQQASQPLPTPSAPRHEPTPLREPEAEAETEPETRHRPANLSAAAANRYSWASRTSNDGLMSPALGSDISSPPLNPPSTFARFRPGYQPVPDRYGSPANEPEHERSNSYSSEDDVSQPISRTKSPLVESYTAPTSPQKATPAPRNPTISTVGGDEAGESQHTTPRANNLRPTSNTSDGLYDHSPNGPTSRAVHPAAAPIAPRAQSGQLSPTKRMTRKEFEAQRRVVSPDESEESEDSEDEGYDDDDEAERQAELARQRRKQEANMSVYRQQMKKVAGGNPSELPSQTSRPSLDRASYSAPGLTRDFSSASLGAEVDEEDDEVPLGILQAHGFPGKNRPPTRLGSAPPTPGGAGSVVNNGMGGGSLPVFARNLPADPYFGAGLVNPINRESLAFGSGGSVYGGASPSMYQLPQMPQMPPQQMPGMPQAGGGLVGVIAGEERARAARRVNHNGGTPFNANGLPLPGNMNMPQMPQMPRSNSMMSMAGPQMGPQMGMGGFMPQMPQMMGGDQNAQQMMQLMFQQTQMMQQMMAMQGGQMPQMPQMPQINSPQMQNGFPNMLPNGMQRPMSMGGPNGQQPGMLGPQGSMHQQQRSSTMTNLQPPGYAGSMYDYSLSAPRGGYTPSIAPSERSNVGMPSRYRPVTMEGSNSRTASMTSQSGIQNFANKNASGSFLNPNNIPAANGSNVPRTTIKVIDKPKGSPRSPQMRPDEEDDDEGWAQLRKKREERRKRGTAGKSQEQTLKELYSGFN
ncbi:hypothetical protein AUEXF2481DRAFT_7791 [Aureobasidium subglaciale EXF-2481]|uniref:Uncharacterized protein n=1 Tax=Aureobasidium subglaciale (strain EXF-2481) TaxID=1043005 RepID=A0A074YZS4_AURSE|nr:uncharacterized protein AUEXF2481DRAFT_7791 [Aureobasidium subglaciale EXF-2481]KAI5202262.1 hypothetical protein E4T38_05666 [Aureobasidium subglaciale]KAI5221065.1 hypothetical protein E4T40_05696 [Aureobasidium subglaciale]KAI5224310.1 hypothetical protein E4T41_05645 [Aureobasidium subglaciale]KAI5261029.1 hypothetical protein E4T46_05420 [Aureobasidium subglaciale]KEQ92396.1 hypothetical protein AUEXF2481DRAFT_7791 [Aureobasidium subglaciale EXF-2481]